MFLPPVFGVITLLFLFEVDVLIGERTRYAFFILILRAVLLSDKGVVAMNRLAAPASAPRMIARRLTVGCPGSDAAACVAGAADGTTVVLEAREYTWLSEVTVENKRLTITGAGRGSTTVNRKQGGRFFTLMNGGHVTVEHLSMTGGKRVRSAMLRDLVAEAASFVMLNLVPAEFL